MWRNAPLHIALVILVALAALFVMRVRGAGGVTVAETKVSEGHRLAKSWCEGCHVIEPNMPPMPGPAPRFEAIANQPGITPLALKVFLKTSHKDMPNLIIAPSQADALVSYILSLKSE